MECTHSETKRFGRNRNGSQRLRCLSCGATFTDNTTRPIDRRKLSGDKAALALRMLLEGNSIRSVERLLGIPNKTIIRTMVLAGQAVGRFLPTAIKGVPVDDVEADEIWSFVGCKERWKKRMGYGEEMGDAWTYVAMERTTKLVLCHHVGKRDSDNTWQFAWMLDEATSGKFQLTTDGYRPYRSAMSDTFQGRASFAQLVKVYSTTPDGVGPESRYSPGQVVDTYKVVIIGRPNKKRVCTSHAERQNLTMRMTIRRLTRLTNAHSKKWLNHEAAVALYFGYYNFCRVHQTLKTTPAVASGLTDHVWSLEELLAKAA
ncbi:MAG: hypothetical protein ACJ8C4_08270 [Gemmataceae bacterium]